MVDCICLLALVTSSILVQMICKNLTEGQSFKKILMDQKAFIDQMQDLIWDNLFHLVLLSKTTLHEDIKTYPSLVFS